jgi:transglutaminase-like putative cysteine protease
MTATAVHCTSESHGSAAGAATAILLVRAAADDRSTVLDESLEVDGAAVEAHELSGGSRPLRLHAAPGPMTVRYEAEVALLPPVQAAATGSLPSLAEIDLSLHAWTLPSRYCPSDLLAASAAALFADQPPHVGLLVGVCDWVRANIAYVPGTSDVHTAADQTLLRRTGVCRDLAHLAITLLRALDVPARMVAGYAVDLDPPDFHAIVEAHDGAGWRLLDPTGLAPVGTVVRIATGRDAADVAWASTGSGLALERLQVGAALR